jgi:hypothetical protein
MNAQTADSAPADPQLRLRGLKSSKTTDRKTASEIVREYLHEYLCA